MARAIEAGDMLASSDPHGLFILKVFAADPGQFAAAFVDERLVGFIAPEFKIAVVAPERRREGIGRALVDIGIRMERDRGRPELLLGVLPAEPVGTAFLGAVGMTYHSTVWDLDLPPGADVPRPAWPEGYRGRLFDRTRDLDDWVRVFNAAFADHPTPLQLNTKLIGPTLEDPDNDDGDIVLVEETATGELVGFCNIDTARRQGTVAQTAELWGIGVRPDRQGRGLGRQLVRAGVERVHAMGIANVSLSVNARNESALGLYESEGFVRTRTRDRWSRPVAAADAREVAP